MIAISKIIIDERTILDKLLENECSLGVKKYSMDERVESNLYVTSWSNSSKIIDSVEVGREDLITQNDWLKEISTESELISTISLDNLKERLFEYGEGIENLQSCDALNILNKESMEAEDCYHLMIEFKNTNRSIIMKMLEMDNDDNIINKCKGSVKLIETKVYFYAENDGKDIIGKTHFIIVYGGRADTVKDGPRRQFYKKKEKINGRVSGAAPMTSSEIMTSSKKDKEIFSSFSKEIEKLGLAHIIKKHLGDIKGEPDFTGGKPQKRFYSLLTSKDFANLIDNGYFEKMIKDYGEMK